MQIIEHLDQYDRIEKIASYSFGLACMESNRSKRCPLGDEILSRFKKEIGNQLFTRYLEPVLSDWPSSIPPSTLSGETLIGIFRGYRSSVFKYTVFCEMSVYTLYDEVNFSISPTGTRRSSVESQDTLLTMNDINSIVRENPKLKENLRSKFTRLADQAAGHLLRHMGHRFQMDLFMIYNEQDDSAEVHLDMHDLDRHWIENVDEGDLRKRIPFREPSGHNLRTRENFVIGRIFRSRKTVQTLMERRN